VINLKFKKNKLLFSFVSLFLVFYLIFLTAPIPSNASQGDLVWTRSMGGLNNDIGNDIVVDSSYNVYTVGFFMGTVDFDPGLGVHNLVSAGNADFFISKLDSNGNFLWAKRFGGTGYDNASGVALDSDENIYLTGEFSGTVDFDPGPGVFNLVSSGGADIFILKLDSNGDFLYAQSFGSVSQDRGVAVAVDQFNNVVVSGTFFGTVDFNFDLIDTHNLVSNGNTDIFILKLNPAGTFLHAQSFGGTGFETLEDLTLDSSGNIYTTGAFQNTVDFDPDSVDVFNITATGSEDLFISKLDPNGNFLWAHGIGSVASGKSIATDQFNNVYVTSGFSNTVDLDPDPVDVFNLTSAGGQDVFILKLDSNGAFLWAKKLGGTNDEIGYTIAIDSNNNIYTTGYMDGLGDFDPGPGVFNLDILDDQYMFISKLDSNGDFLWAKQIGGHFFDQIQNTAFDLQNNLYLTGTFNEQGDFDTSEDVFNMTSLGLGDIFILKLGDASGPVLSEVTPVGVVVNNFTPTYTFNSNEAGIISYQGACSSTTTSAVLGNNTITLNHLSVGYYDNCTILVTDNLNNQSLPLQITPFSIVVHSGGSGIPTVDPQPETDLEPETEPEIIIEIENETDEDIPIIAEPETEVQVSEPEIIVVPDSIIPIVTPNENISIIQNPTPTPNINPTINPIVNEWPEIKLIPFEPIFENPIIETIDDLPVVSVVPFYKEESINIISYLNQQALISFNDAKEIFVSYLKELRKIFNQKEIDLFVKILGALGLISGLLVSLASTIFASPISFAEIPLIPFRIWSLLMSVLGIKKRTRRWGVVYDSITKQPLDPAYVTLKNLEGETIATAITDIDGRYGFIVQPGTYALTVNKTNYLFPSAKLAGRHADELYDNIYWGDYFNISIEGEVIARNIPLDPINFSWNEFEKEKRNLTSSFKRKDLLVSRIASILFNIGFVIACIAFIVTPLPYNGIIFSLYIFIFIIKKIGIKTKNKGSVVEKSTGLPLSYGIIRVMYSDIGQEIAHSVIDKYGNFYCLVKNGTYTVKIDKKNPDGSYSLLYKQSLITINDGVLNKKFEV